MRRLGRLVDEAAAELGVDPQSEEMEAVLEAVGGLLGNIKKGGPTTGTAGGGATSEVEAVKQLNKAATLIQATWRRKMARRRVATLEDQSRLAASYERGGNHEAAAAVRALDSKAPGAVRDRVPASRTTGGGGGWRKRKSVKNLMVTQHKKVISKHTIQVAAENMVEHLLKMNNHGLEKNAAAPARLAKGGGPVDAQPVLHTVEEIGDAISELKANVALGRQESAAVAERQQQMAGQMDELQESMRAVFKMANTIQRSLESLDPTISRFQVMP
eukprot:SAG22_NODE_942_length_6401_cov_9.094000_5_plen_273_part_00